MRVFLSILIIILGFLLSGIWFGTTLLLEKTKFGKMEYAHFLCR